MAHNSIGNFIYETGTYYTRKITEMPKEVNWKNAERVAYSTANSVGKFLQYSLLSNSFQDFFKFNMYGVGENLLLSTFFGILSTYFEDCAISKGAGAEIDIMSGYEVGRFFYAASNYFNEPTQLGIVVSTVTGAATSAWCTFVYDCAG